jgi:hypothetical protein
LKRGQFSVCDEGHPVEREPVKLTEEMVSSMWRNMNASLSRRKACSFIQI